MITATKQTKTKQNQIKQSKLIGVRVSPQMYDILSELAKQERRTISNYIRNILEDKMDTTEYLLSSQNNAKRLKESLEEANKDNLVAKTLEELRTLEN